MNALVYSSSLAAAFLGGILALFAPCCIVSLLPMFVGAAIEPGRVRLPIASRGTPRVAPMNPETTPRERSTKRRRLG